MRKPDQPSNAGNLEEVADWGRFFLVTFLGKTRKVTSRRATPGEVDFVIMFHNNLNGWAGEWSAATRRPFDRLRANGINSYIN